MDSREGAFWMRLKANRWGLYVYDFWRRWLLEF